MKFIRLALQILLPLALLAGGAWLANRIANRAPQPVVLPPAARAPLVRTIAAAATDLRIDVRTQGTVEPFRTFQLGPQVGGRVVATHPSLRAGGFAAAGEVLVEIDAADFELAVVQQEAAVARAELRLLQERAEADSAVRAWKELEGERPAEPLVARAPQIADAEKALAGARAALAKSRLDLQRTKLVAPADCRVRSANVETGQTVQPGQVLAELFDTAAVEVRLPIPAADAAFLELPLAGTPDDGRGPEVALTAEFAGTTHEWKGRIVRTESEVDRRTRQVTAVARVEAPFAAAAGRPPLLVGMFVQALVHGRTFPGVVALPRAALRGDGEVWIAEAQPGGDLSRLRRRAVQPLRSEADRVLLRSGLAPGELVCVTNLEAMTEGLQVRVQPTEPGEPADRNGIR